MPIARSTEPDDAGGALQGQHEVVDRARDHHGQPDPPDGQQVGQELQAGPARVLGVEPHGGGG